MEINLFLLFSGLLCAVVGVFYLWWIQTITYLSAFLFTILLIFTTFRNYSDVEFKLNTSFVRYFFFYFSISVGYILGLLIYQKTNQWIIIFLTGEAAGIIYAIFASKLYRRPVFRPSKNFRLVLKKYSFSSFFQSIRKSYLKC